jgi:DNA-binding transcriptional ArsR family regulator
VIEGGYPADGTAGHSGGVSSAEAATDPKLGRRQRQILDSLLAAGHYGWTQNELSRELGLGHGVVSGALTRLHRAGLTTRLAARRDGQHVYVAVEFAAGKDESPYRPQSGSKVIPRSAVVALVERIGGRYGPHATADTIHLWLNEQGIGVERDG